MYLLCNVPDVLGDDTIQRREKGAADLLPHSAPVCSPGIPTVCSPGIPTVCSPGIPTVCSPGIPTVCSPGIPTVCSPGIPTTQRAPTDQQADSATVHDAPFTESCMQYYALGEGSVSYAADSGRVGKVAQITLGLG